jgi:hypothetical protein
MTALGPWMPRFREKGRSGYHRLSLSINHGGCPEMPANSCSERAADSSKFVGSGAPSCAGRRGSGLGIRLIGENGPATLVAPQQFSRSQEQCVSRVRDRKVSTAGSRDTYEFRPAADRYTLAGLERWRRALRRGPRRHQRGKAGDFGTRPNRPVGNIPRNAAPSPACRRNPAHVTGRRLAVGPNPPLLSVRGVPPPTRCGWTR